jgi:hypothetical protein
LTCDLYDNGGEFGFEGEGELFDGLDLFQFERDVNGDGGVLAGGL